LSTDRLKRFKEASQGYFHDYNKARKAFGGKLWTAPNTLIREDVSDGRRRWLYNGICARFANMIASTVFPRYQWQKSDGRESAHDRCVEG